MEKLFVYGTLLSGYQNQTAQYLHKHSQFLGNAYCMGTLFMIEDYPGLVLEGSQKVFGELYKIPKSVLIACDEYEESHHVEIEQNEYLRQRIEVSLKGKITTCWTYLYNRDFSNLSIIESGNFRLADRLALTELRPREQF